MERKKHIISKDKEKGEVLLRRDKSVFEKVERILVPKEVPEPTLAQQQELVKRVMTRVKKAREQKQNLSGILTTLRDIVTCTDSFLIRASSYALATIILLAIAGGILLLVWSVTSSTLTAFSQVPASRILISKVVSKSVMGKMLYKRSMEDFILSHTTI
ncbi:hypothetical protein J7M23_10085 [Candidatus Sumerlaeota bacterium]|nr:hypothetical protein [Candidatus Sumerlaeota bacterium]